MLINNFIYCGFCDTFPSLSHIYTSLTLYVLQSVTCNRNFILRKQMGYSAVEKLTPAASSIRYNKQLVEGVPQYCTVGNDRFLSLSLRWVQYVYEVCYCEDMVDLCFFFLL